MLNKYSGLCYICKKSVPPLRGSYWRNPYNEKMLRCKSCMEKNNARKNNYQSQKGV